MDATLSKYLLYFPVTLLKGELVFLYLNEYRKFQWKSSDEIEAYQLRKLTDLLKTVVSNNKFYKSLYAEHGIKSCDIKDLRDMAKLPSVTKQDLITCRDDISSLRGRFSSVKTTGGSTGEPVRLFKSASALARERAATWRSYEWAGVRIGDPQARFWGVPHSTSARLIARATDFISNRRRLSAFDITPERLKSYYAELQLFKPAYLYGYVSGIERFAEYLLEKNLEPIPTIKSVITTSEVLSPGARATIESAFGVKVFNEYGCGEVGSIAHECEYGNMHIMADNLIVEIDRNDNGSGEIVVTDLFNQATPLIRYRLGDFASFAEGLCPCGRGLPIISSVHGRAYDLIKLPSGKVMHPEAVIYVFESIQQKTGKFKQFQAIQQSQTHMRIKLVPVSEINDDDIRDLVSQLRKDICQDMHYEVEICANLEREKSGKMRVVKSMV